jgi:hypothetical protein
MVSVAAEAPLTARVAAKAAPITYRNLEMNVDYLLLNISHLASDGNEKISIPRICKSTDRYEHGCIAHDVLPVEPLLHVQGTA